MKKLLLLLFGGLFCTSVLWAQQTMPINGVKDDRVEIHAFTNATIYTDYQTKLENATLLISGNKVVAVGSNVTIPAEAIVHDATGSTIYTSFIDLYIS